MGEDKQIERRTYGMRTPCFVLLYIGLEKTKIRKCKYWVKDIDLNSKLNELKGMISTTAILCFDFFLMYNINYVWNEPSYPFSDIITAPV